MPTTVPDWSHLSTDTKVARQQWLRSCNLRSHALSHSHSFQNDLGVVAVMMVVMMVMLAGCERRTSHYQQHEGGEN